MPFLGNAQTKPRDIINPFIHRNNATWNNATKQEKDSILEQAFLTDNVWTHNYIEGEYECGDFARQTLINYNGYPELDTLELHFHYSAENNGKYKIPAMMIYRTAQGHPAHIFNAVLTGDDIKNFNDWYFWEPQHQDPETKKVELGDWSMPANSRITMAHTLDWVNEIGPNDTLITHCRDPTDNYLEFQLDSVTPYFVSHESGHLVLKNPIHDSIPPEVNCSVANNSIVNANTLGIEISAKDFYAPFDSLSSFLDSLKYKIDDTQQQDILCQKESINPFAWLVLPVHSISKNISTPLEDGAHQIEIYATDLKPNITDTIIHFIQDGTQPELVVNSPKDSTYHINKIPLDFLASDANLDSASSYFQLNSENKIYLNQQIPDSITSKQGANNLKIWIYDLAQT